MGFEKIGSLRDPAARHQTRLLLSVIILFAGGSLAFGQAGSTGGAIGKTDKSISGTEAAPNSRSEKRTPERANGPSLCDKVAGSWMWRWLNNSAVVTLSADGTSSASNGNSGSWTCAGRTVVVNWPLGPDALTLSADARRLAGKGVMGIGVTGTRLSSQ